MKLPAQGKNMKKKLKKKWTPKQDEECELGRSHRWRDTPWTR